MASLSSPAEAGTPRWTSSPRDLRDTRQSSEGALLPGNCEPHGFTYQEQCGATAAATNETPAGANAAGVTP